MLLLPRLFWRQCMNLGRTVFSQLVNFFPTYQFQICVDRYQGNRYVKEFSCWDQFLCLAFAQLTYRESLRDIEACLRAQQPKLYHMGFRGQVSRNTLAHANEHRDWRIYADFAQVLIAAARDLYRGESFPTLPIRRSPHASPCYHRPCCLSFGDESEPGMTARTLDGQKIREQIFAELSDEVRLLTAAGVRPGLAAVLVGDNPASQLYVKSKIAACQQLGLSSALITPPATVTTLDLLAVVEDLNRDNDVDGILVQLPLPSQVDTKRILEAVDPAKDVDGFHPVNLGRLVSGRPGLVACTPAGCMEILRRNDIKIEGANAVVLGRSDIVGKPMALLLMHANATVTICHSKTRDLPDIVRRGVRMHQ